MRILYLGLPLGAAVLLRHGTAPVAVAIFHLDAPGVSRLRRRLPRSTLLLGRPELDDGTIREVLASARPDAVLSWFWPRRIPQALLDVAPRGAFGVHPSLLPRWRGPDPYFHAIAAGDAITGVTLHRLERAYDTGPIVRRIEVPILPEDDAWTLARRLDRPALQLLVECARALERGEPLVGEPQDESRATEAPRPGADELVLRFAERDADSLARLVRAACPEPGATALLERTFVTVLRARPWRGTFPGGLAPGEAFCSAEGVVVRAASDGLLLERVRVEDDDQILEGRAIASLLLGDRPG